jgi:L-ascorbate metabolism protein UlaG (beta-lactamase superfamily)
MPNIRLIRHATLLVEIGDVTFLVDPMLGAPGTIPPIPNTPNQRENPLVAAPEVPLEYDAVLVTHRHRDHFDEAAKEALPDGVPLFCQPVEADDFHDDGFTDVRPVDDEATFGGVTLTRTPARHGHGDLADKMAPVSGFVLAGDRRLYLAGDTVWYDAVPAAIDRYEPDAVVVNAGGARFHEGEPITMDAGDVARVRTYVDVPVVAVHMDAINHCLVTRADLREAVADVDIPADGERVAF